MRQSLFAVLLAVSMVACSDRGAESIDQSVDADRSAIGLSSLVKISGPQAIIGISDNASGLTYDPLRAQLWLVINDPPELVSLSLEGVVLKRYPLPLLEDLEGVTLISSTAQDTHLAVLEERRNRLTELHLSDGQIRIGAHHKLPDGGMSARLNRGPEGLAWMPSTGRIRIVKEKSPTMLFSADLSRTEDNIRVESCESADLLSDWSGVSAIPGSEHWLLLSDESSALIELDQDCRVIDRLQLSDLGASEPLVPQAEGVVFTETGVLYLISEPNLFYVYQRSD